MKKNMQDIETLRKQLRPLNGKDYGAYQSLFGNYDYKTFKLFIHQIPKDPYAPHMPAFIWFKFNTKIRLL